jgi:hypothetical protein
LPQGLLKKIQLQLLPANLALKLDNARSGLHKFRMRRQRPCRR